METPKKETKEITRRDSLMQGAREAIGQLPREKLEEAYAEYWTARSRPTNDEKQDENYAVFRTLAEDMRLWVLIHAVRGYAKKINEVDVESGEVWYCPRGCHTVSGEYTEV